MSVIFSALDKLVEAVAPTFGPHGKKVILNDGGVIKAIDDGVKIAKSIELQDENERIVAELVKQAAVKTNERAGDGTTGSLIILQAILHEIRRRGVYNVAQIRDELKKGSMEAVVAIRKLSKKIKTLEQLCKVARTSYNDEEVSKIIAELAHQMGPDGIITVEDHPAMETISEIVDGVEVRKGFISPFMANPIGGSSCEMIDPLILLTEFRLTSVNDVVPIIEKVAALGKNQLVIVAENVEGDALGTLVGTKLKGKTHFETLAICAPKFGEGRSDFMRDLAMVTGATIANNETGLKVDEMTLEHLGTCPKVLSKRDHSVFFLPKKKSNEAKKHIQNLIEQADQSKTEYDRDNLQERIATLRGKVATIKVGANTVAEKKSAREKVEDSVNATKAALKGGVVAGAGVTLASLKTSSPILNKAFQAPIARLKENSGVDFEVKPGQAYNLISGEAGDPMIIGVIDPVDVLIAQVESAVSIAIELISTGGIIVDLDDKKV